MLAASGTFDPEPLPTPPAETVTAEPPTPTVDPVERDFEPTAFSAVLPDTVLDLALAEIAEGGSLEDGEVAPIEAYTATYSDGGEKQVTLDAAQFADEETATSAVPELSGDSGETGEVLADGILVGEFAMVRGVNGAATLVWRNSTAVFVLEGPEDVVRDVYRAFPV